MLSIQQIEKALLPTPRPLSLRPGDKVRVHVRIDEPQANKAADKGRPRLQVYEGTVISIKHGGARRTFTVRKVSYGVGVERIFPLESPVVEQIEVMSHHRVRRAKLYFLRSRHGKSARLKEIRG